MLAYLLIAPGSTSTVYLSVCDVSLLRTYVVLSLLCSTHRSMTPLNKVFMLPADARLNRSTMKSILASGHSRIPVYAGGDRSNIIGLILVKELLQYKTHQEVPVSDVRMRSLPRCGYGLAAYCIHDNGCVLS